ncbi:MAG: UDP-2,3-diacylglucosamine diphosphatase LpxI [Mesorhizobium sp.]
MTTTKTESRLLVRFGADSRVGVVAGGGRLPEAVADALEAQGARPYVVLVAGEADPAGPLAAHDHSSMELEHFASLVPLLKRNGVTHVVLAGEIKRRPRLSKMRMNFSILATLPRIALELTLGDDGLLRAVLRYIERRGIKVVGAHEVVPELVAAEGCLTKAQPQKPDWRDIDTAREAAEAIGALDIGQGAVAIGGRVIALEGIEGTDGLLARVKDLRSHGRLAGRMRGVLVKCAKPGQEARADLPSIGPNTVEMAHAAGLAGIAVEAGHSLVLDGPAMIERADALGLFVIGLPAKGSTP